MIDTGAIRKKVLEMAMKGELTQRCNNDSCCIPQGHALTKVSDIPYKIPDTWIWTTVGDVIAKNVGGGTPSKSVTEYWKNGTIPWATVKDFSSAKNGMISDTVDHITQVGLDNSSANLIDTDAIVICMRMALGKIVRFSKPMAINQDLRAVWLQPFILQSFFVYFYSTLKVEGRGTTVAGIRKEELMSFPIPVPPLAEQQRIVERVESIFSLLDEIDEAQTSFVKNQESLRNKLIETVLFASNYGKITTEEFSKHMDLM